MPFADAPVENEMDPVFELATDAELGEVMMDTIPVEEDVDEPPVMTTLPPSAEEACPPPPPIVTVPPLFVVLEPPVTNTPPPSPPDARPLAIEMAPDTPL